MNLPNPSVLSKILENLYTFNTSLERLEKGLEAVNKEVSGLRTDIAGLAVRVAVLEETRKTVDLEMKLAVAKEVAEVKQELLKTQSDLHIKFAEVVADLRIQVAQQSEKRLPLGKNDSEG